MKKRIICLIESLGSGGAERQLTGLAVMLKQQGYEVEVWYYVNQDFYLPYLQENNVTGRFLPDANRPRKRFFSLKKYIKDFQPDTVISFSASSSMIVCMLKLLGAKFNLIVSERNTTQKLDFREKLRFCLYRWANHIVPNSQSQAEFITRHFLNLSGKIKVITNFVDTNRFRPCERNNNNDNFINIICVGRLKPQKNVLLFIEAIKSLAERNSNFKVNWYGYRIDDEYSKSCFDLVNKLGLQDVFFIHPAASDIVSKYCSADVFCLPSIYEGFPNVLCEAMCCGLPVVCSRVCDNPNIVEEGENGLMFNPLDKNDIVTTIEKILTLSVADRNKKGKASRQRSLALFSTDAFIEKYLRII